MTNETLTPEALEIIRGAAKLIEENGWLMMHGETATQMGVPGIGLTTAVCWAAHGSPCKARDMDDAERECALDVLECLEIMLGTSVTAYERRHVGARPSYVSSELRHVAYILGTPLDDQ